jgi:hypothetical protein
MPSAVSYRNEQTNNSVQCFDSNLATQQAISYLAMTHGRLFVCITAATPLFQFAAVDGRKLDHLQIF